MRSRAVVVLCCVMTFAWWGCEEASGPADLQGPQEEALFGAQGPPPGQCDVKQLPARDYFDQKSDVQEVSGWLRDLSAACVDGLVGESYDFGFQILAAVETARRVPAADEVYAAGGEIVAGVWTAMTFVGPPPECNPDPDNDFSGCELPAVDTADVRRALAPGGAFGVRGGSSAAPVFSQGDPDATRWGVEPPVGSSWAGVLPADPALIFGFPDNGSDLPDEFSIGRFDFTVAPWYGRSSEAIPLLVGSCAEPLGADVARYAHEGAIIPRGGGEPSYCDADDPLLATGFGERLTRFAAAALPFWPRRLDALLAPKSESGSARDFSPFDEYSIQPDAKVAISQPFADTDPTKVGDPICFGFECGNFTASWTTQAGSALATRETVLVFTKDNNGAKVDFEAGWDDVGRNLTCTDTGLNEISCTCDAREGTTDACTGIEISGLALNKPGGYQLCVQSVETAESSGLNIAACTETFHISPN